MDNVCFADFAACGVVGVTDGVVGVLSELFSVEVIDFRGGLVCPAFLFGAVGLITGCNGQQADVLSDNGKRFCDGSPVVSNSGNCNGGLSVGAEVCVPGGNCGVVFVY